MKYVFQSTGFVKAERVYTLDSGSPDTESGQFTKFSAATSYDSGQYKALIKWSRPVRLTTRPMIFIAGAQAYTTTVSTYTRFSGTGASIIDTIGWRVRAITGLPDSITWNSILSSEYVGETLIEETLIDFDYLDADTEAADRELRLSSFCVPVKEVSSEDGVTLYGVLIDGINTNGDGLVTLTFANSIGFPNTINPCIIGDR